MKNRLFEITSFDNQVGMYLEFEIEQDSIELIHHIRETLEKSLFTHFPNARLRIETWIDGDENVVESCEVCKTEQSFVWTAPDELWEKLAEKNIYCPKCFDDLANKKGLFLRWIPREEFARKE